MFPRVGTFGGSRSSEQTTECPEKLDACLTRPRLTMKKQPIHQNLNTSFVNVTALVRYLKGLQFVGSIRLELASYEAEIIFTESNTIRAREYDHVAGRISHGEHALKRILIRAKEPNGRVNVYKAAEGYSGRYDGSVFVDKTIMRGARNLAGNTGGNARNIRAGREFMSGGRDSRNSPVLAAVSEILRVVDESLATGNLSFPAAFRVACDGIAPRFPFLQSDSTALVYKNGEIKLNVQVDSDLVLSAVFAALRPIFRRLRRELKYEGLLEMLSDRLLKISTERRTEFVNLGLMNYVRDLLADE